MNGHVSSLDSYEPPPTPVIENFFHKKFSKVKRRPGSSSAESEPESNVSESSSIRSSTTTKLIVENNNLKRIPHEIEKQSEPPQPHIQNSTNLIITHVKKERMDDSEVSGRPKSPPQTSPYDTSPFKPVAITRKPALTDTIPPRPPYTLPHPPAISAFAPPVAPPTAPFHPHTYPALLTY